jgi:neutral ceramidase
MGHCEAEIEKRDILIAYDARTALSERAQGPLTAPDLRGRLYGFVTLDEPFLRWKRIAWLRTFGFFRVDVPAHGFQAVAVDMSWSRFSIAHPWSEDACAQGLGSVHLSRRDSIMPRARSRTATHVTGATTAATPVLVSALLLLVSLPAVASEQPPDDSLPPLRAGAATSNITPPLGIRIVGSFAPHPAEHVHDELHARCLVLDDGETKIALVVCDLLGLHRSVSIEARRLIEQQTGIPPENVLISATHTHSAGTALGKNRYANDQELDDYQQFVARRIADGVRRALNLLRPAEVAFTSVDVPEQVHNRRWLMREGSVPPNPFGEVDQVRTNPPVGSPDLIEPAGPVDPTVSIIALREPDGRLISVYCAYSLHYVGGSGPAHVSADYFAMFCERLKKLQGDEEADPPFVALLANGTSGDINNIDRLNPRPRGEPYERMREVAADVAGKVHAALGEIESWQDRVTLEARYRELQLSWRTVEPELLKWAAKVEEAPRVLGGNVPVGAKWTTTREFVRPLSYSGRVQLLADADGPALVPVQVLRIGDIAIGTSPCETFAEIGLEFKQRSPWPHSFMVSLAHGYIGYLPTPRHFELGGYETWPGTNYLEPQTSVKMLDALIEMADFD